MKKNNAMTEATIKEGDWNVSNCVKKWDTERRGERVRASRNRQIAQYQLHKGNNQTHTFMKAEAVEGIVPWDFIMCFYCNFPVTAALRSTLSSKLPLLSFTVYQFYTGWLRAIWILHLSQHSSVIHAQTFANYWVQLLYPLPQDPLSVYVSSSMWRLHCSLTQQGIFKNGK